MKTPRTAAKLIAIVMALGLAVIGNLWGSDPVTAGPAQHLFTTGMFGLARGQTARINAANVFDPDTIYVEIMLLDSTGNIVARSERLELSPGRASFLDLPFEDLKPTESLRIELHAVVKASGDPNIGKPAFTAEVFDQDTLKSTLFLPSDSFEECACGAQ